MLKDWDIASRDGKKLWVNTEADIPIQRIRMLNLVAAIAERAEDDELRLDAANVFLTQTIPTDKELNQ